MSDEKDYSREDQAAIRSIEKRLNRQEQLATASAEMVKKLAKEAFRDKATRNSIARDCIEGIQGRIRTSDDPRRFVGKDGARVPSSMIEEPLPTGYDKFPWQDDSEDE